MEKSLLLYKVVDGEATAFPSAAEQLQLSGFTYKAARMGGAPTITGTIKSATSLEGQWDDVFVTFNQERFYVRTEPDNTKENTESLESYSITFYSQRYELDNVYMIDAVQSDSSIDGYQSNSTKVQFMGDITEWAARLNASFGYSGLTTEGWSVVVDSDITSEDKMMSFEDKFISEALQEGFNVYNVPYYFVGKVIHFGYTSNAITTPFEYGAANSLLSIQKNNANYKIVNRCSGYGSSDNLPYYYPNTSPKGTVAAEAASTNTTLQTSHITVFNAERFANKVSTTDVISYIKPTLTFSSKQVELYDEDTETYQYSTLSNSTISQLYKFSNYVAYIPMKIVVTANISAKYKILFPVRINGVLKSISNLHNVTVDGVDSTNSVTLNASDSSFEIYLTAGSHTIYYTVVASIYYDASYLTRVINITWSSDGEASWYQGSTKITDLSTLGVRVSVTPTSGDSFHQVVATGSYITPVDTLMPPIFRSSGGTNRFYNALNNTYQKPDGSGYYSFNHPYESGDRREQTVAFDDIKPTIEGMTNAASQAMNKFLAFAWDTNDNDEIDPDTGEYVHPYFFAKLPKYDGTNGFNLFDCSSESGNMTIAMTSGVCGSCEFEIHVGEDTQKNTVQVDSSGNLLRNSKGEVRCGCESLGQAKETPQDRQNDTKNYEVWVALAKDATTYPTVMPSSQRGLVPSVNDTFTILNIALPQAYITAAEEKLKQEIIAYMALNNDEKFSFSIAFSRIYFEENPTVLAQLNENARILVRHHNTNYTFYISNFTYSMKDGDVLPDVTVDLVDELTSSSNSLQQKIDAVKQDLLNTVGDGDVLKTGLKYFLRKDVEDYASEKIHFQKGVTFGSFTTGALGAGGAVQIDDNGNSYAEFDYLTVRKKAIFKEVSIDKIQAAGGTIIVSPASLVISSVETYTGYYRCYFDTDGGDGRNIENTFAVGDLARCQTYNLTETKYYWRQVISIGTNYIDLSRASGQYDTDSGIPEAGDSIVAIGNVTDTDRRAAIMISAFGTDSPSIKMYQGISSFSLTSKDMFGVMYDATNHRSHLYNYGSLYLGQRDGTANYISYNGEVLKICAKVEFASGSSGLANLNEWTTLNARITRATTAAEAAEDAIEQLNDDEILDVYEKRQLRISWEAINGVDSVTQTAEETGDDCGSYYQTKADFDAYAFPTQSSVFVYNGVTYTYAQKALLYTVIGVDDLDNTYLTLRSELASLELYEDVATEDLDARVLSEKFTAYYDAEKQVYNNVTKDNKDKYDDLSYLKTLLTPDEDVTTIEGGVVLSTIIGVQASNNLRAAINASSLGQDTTHGTLMMFAGVGTDSEQTLAQNVASSAFRVYQDGYVYASHFIADGATLTSADVTGKITATQGAIGDFAISDGKMSVSGKTKQYSGITVTYGASIAADEIEMQSSFADSTTPSTGERGTEKAWLLATSRWGSDWGLLTLQSRKYADSTGYFELTSSLIRLDAQVSGGMNHRYKHPKAIVCDSGEFLGLRPYTRRITTEAAVSTNDFVLSDLDYNVIYEVGYSHAITLPSSPKMGQTYRIIKGTAAASYAITINYNGVSYTEYNDRSAPTYSGGSRTDVFSAGYTGVKEFVYDGSRWHVFTLSVYDTNTIYENSSD